MLLVTSAPIKAHAQIKLFTKCINVRASSGRMLVSLLQVLLGRSERGNRRCLLLLLLLLLLMLFQLLLLESMLPLETFQPHGVQVVVCWL